MQYVVVTLKRGLIMCEGRYKSTFSVSMSGGVRLWLFDNDVEVSANLLASACKFCLVSLEQQA